MDKSLINFFNMTPTEFSSAVIVLNLVFVFLIELFIVWVYRKTHKGLSYSHSFPITLIIMGMLATVVMMVIQNNLIGAFGLLGAFSLIRFRTIMKETRDIAFVFFALAEGVAIGTNNYMIAFISTFIIVLVIFVLSRLKYGHRVFDDFLLSFVVEDNLDKSKIDKIFGNYFKKIRLIHIRSLEGTDFTEHLFAVEFNNDDEAEHVISELRGFPEIQKVDLVTAEHSVEY